MESANMNVSFVYDLTTEDLAGKQHPSAPGSSPADSIPGSPAGSTSITPELASSRSSLDRARLDPEDLFQELAKVAAEKTLPTCVIRQWEQAHPCKLRTSRGSTNLVGLGLETAKMGVKTGPSSTSAKLMAEHNAGKAHAWPVGADFIGLGITAFEEARVAFKPVVRRKKAVFYM